VMSCVECVTGHARSPGAPDAKNIVVVELGESSLLPQRTKRGLTIWVPAFGRRRPRRGRRRDRLGSPRTSRVGQLVGDHSGDVGMVLLAHESRVKSVPGVNVTGDHCSASGAGWPMKNQCHHAVANRALQARQRLADWHVAR